MAIDKTRPVVVGGFIKIIPIIGFNITSYCKWIGFFCFLYILREILQAA